MEIFLISLKIAFVALISCLCWLMLGDTCIISLAYVHWGVRKTRRVIPGWEIFLSINGLQNLIYGLVISLGFFVQSFLFFNCFLLSANFRCGCISNIFAGKMVHCLHLTASLL